MPKHILTKLVLKENLVISLFVNIAVNFIVSFSVLANDSRIEKQKVMSALMEMEDAVQKLSHLSIELSTGSTDL